MQFFRWTPLIIVAALTLLATPALAHNSYATDDGRFIIVLGDQNEPMYSWKWTGLDLIIRDNATGAPVAGVEKTLNATLIAPGGEELTTPLKPQHGAVGRYEFTDGHIYTQPGLYKVRLEGTINGSAVRDTYDLPGPREPMTDFTFPDKDVPTLLTLKADNEALRSELEQLRSELEALQQRMDTMRANGGMDRGNDEDPINEASAPGFGVVAALAALGVAYMIGRRRRE